VEVVDGVDALVLASGSAAQAWFDTVGEVTPPIVISIGPTTTRIAHELGLKVTGTAADHTLEGIVTELERVWRDPRPGSDGSQDVQQSSRIEPVK
jgi:uroporphyrinogen-III synthase